jgi:YD repeat-containing protein
MGSVHERIRCRDAHARDPNGRVSDATAPGLLPTHYDYDADGRVVAISSGTGNDLRRLSFEHTANGWVGGVTDALGQSTAYSLDAIGRTTATLYPDGTSTGFAYDAASNLTRLTPPGKTPHAFEYDPRNLPSVYTPPDLASGTTPTTYAYDADRRLTNLSLPGTSPLTYSYDAAGHLSQVQYDAGNISLSYDATERLIKADSRDGIALSYAYDGALSTSTTWSGTIQGSVTPTYDENFFVTSLTVNGSAVAYQYDDDGLVTRAGALQITRDPSSALLSGTTIGGITSAYAHSPRGELTTQTSTRGATALYAATHTYDALGRIARTTETPAGVTSTNEYAYDLVGQLTQVTTDGTVSAAYSYDEDGNRVSATTGSTSANATYDAQERLLTYSNDTYTYTPRGTLESRTRAGGTTSYNYDALGNLTSVALPDRRNVVYLADAQGRRGR